LPRFEVTWRRPAGGLKREAGDIEPQRIRGESIIPALPPQR